MTIIVKQWIHEGRVIDADIADAGLLMEFAKVALSTVDSLTRGITGTEVQNLFDAAEAMLAEYKVRAAKMEGTKTWPGSAGKDDDGR